MVEFASFGIRLSRSRQGRRQRVFADRARAGVATYFFSSFFSFSFVVLLLFLEGRGTILRTGWIKRKGDERTGFGQDIHVETGTLAVRDGSREDGLCKATQQNSAK